MVKIFDTNLPHTASPAFIDAGFYVRNITGAIVQRVDRKGSRYRADFSFGPVYSDIARALIADMLEAKQSGIRLPYPLLEPQGPSGLPRLNGASGGGTSLPIKGLIPGYVCRVGFWLSIESAAGKHHLHNVQVGGIANAAGELTVTVKPEIQFPFADNSVINLDKPMIEGVIEAPEWVWELNGDRIVPIVFSVEETAI